MSTHEHLVEVAGARRRRTDVAGQVRADIQRGPGACGNSLRGSCLLVNGGRVVGLFRAQAPPKHDKPSAKRQAEQMALYTRHLAARHAAL